MNIQQIRSLCTSHIMCKVSPKNIKGKNVTSQSWLTRQLNDPYVKKSVTEHYRCRSAFKLTEMDDKYKILRPGHVVVDIGAAPGSWCQVAVKRVNSLKQEPGKPKGFVIGVDIQHMNPIEGAVVLTEHDFTARKTQDKLYQILNGKKVDVVVSDMAPNATGIKSMDHEVIVRLCLEGLKFSSKVLKKDGTYLCKLWQGGDWTKLEATLKIFFPDVRIVKPPASRSDSAEVFALSRKFTPKTKPQ